MRAQVFISTVALVFSSPLLTEAQRRYSVYKTDSFGNKSALAQPEAIIEEDALSGDLMVYQPGLFGLPDRMRGPTYIIESDSLTPPGSDRSHVRQPPCDEEEPHTHRGRRHHHRDDEEDDEEEYPEENW